jgi:alkylation response protein AidB-like acyl-CoA dehydrogenase
MTAHHPQTALVHVPTTALSASDASKLLTQRLNAVASLVTASKDVFDAAADYLKTREQERTRRAEIDARVRVDLARLQGETETLSTAVQRTFDERGQALQSLMVQLDRAADRNDREAVEALLGAVVATLGHSPLGELARFHQARRGEHVEI